MVVLIPLCHCLETPIWPTLDEWKGKILVIEMSESNIDPKVFGDVLKNLNAQGILAVINGIIVGRPATEDYIEEYKETLKSIVGFEANRPELPIIFNVNVGHAYPICVLPLGIKCRLDCDKKTITLLESATK